MSRLATLALLALLALLGAVACSPRDIELTSNAAGLDAGPDASRGGGSLVTGTFSLPGVPADAAELFARDLAKDATDPAGSPQIIYPSDETMLPRNLDRVLSQWHAPDALDLFEVRFESELAHVTYYTTERSLLPESATWSALAASHAGRSLTLSVRGLARKDPKKIHRSPAITLAFSQSEVLGALYYWSTGTSGIMRAHLAAPGATKFLTDPAAPDAAICVGCHTVSRDGRRLAAGYDGERLRVISVPEREVLIPAAATMAPPPMPAAMPEPMPAPMPMMTPMPAPMMMGDGPPFGWGTFSPDATRLLYADKGALSLMDVATGEKLADVPLPAGYRATHPDWSPDGRFVALTYVASERDLNNKEVNGSSIARLPVDGDAFGEPEVLVASAGKDDTLFFPVYSPDSRWLAFVRAHGKSKDSKSAELVLVSADGGEPIELPRLNRRSGGGDEDKKDLGNSMPTWAPSTRPDVFWLAFSSIRDYGEVLVDAQRDQLWGAAIDPAALAAGEDPSYPAFWMPFQDVGESNHRAFWTLAPEEACPSTIELCDDLDNDCDGVVDDDCCTPEPEQCGNGLDDDCDGVPDEHCDCGEVELCDNGVDDDCDVDVDEDCVL